MRATATSDLWWKTAVIYCLDIETFADGNGDGIGDFGGASGRLDYLEELGVTCVWLMPFYPTPNLDDGYDVTDFYGVDPRLGSLGDVVEFIRTAKDRGMRVITDLVVNHTSERHPWFRSSRRSRTSPHRDYYVWRDEPPAKQRPTVFPGEESGIWELDERTGQYYLHSFYRHQPDLNIANPAVRDEIAKIIGFWLELGISGFRVDAVPFLIEPPDGTDATDPHAMLVDIRKFLQRRSSDAIMLGEVGLPYQEQLPYFGDGGPQLTMQFDFTAMQTMYLSLARQNPAPLAEALASRPEISRESQWAHFVRNHDELTIEQLPEAERNEVFETFAPEETMRAYGRGIVRRLPPMLGGDPRRIRMVYSLLFSLPGTPVLFYGEEIGMGENVELPGRGPMRTPMQWTSDRWGGFTTARRLRVARPPSGGYGPDHVNVASQLHDPDSLFSFMRNLARAYRVCPEIGWGRLRIIDSGQPAVLVHAVDGDDHSLVAVHNFASEPVTVRFDTKAPTESRIADVLGDQEVPTADGHHVELALEGYGLRWLRIVPPSDTVG